MNRDPRVAECFVIVRQKVAIPELISKIELLDVFSAVYAIARVINADYKSYTAISAACACVFGAYEAAHFFADYAKSVAMAEREAQNEKLSSMLKEKEKIRDLNLAYTQILASIHRHAPSCNLQEADELARNLANCLNEIGKANSD